MSVMQISIPESITVYEAGYQIKPLNWLHRLLFWLLRKMGAVTQLSHQRVGVVDVDADGLVEAALKQADAIKRVYHSDAARILVGPDVYYEFMSDYPYGLQDYVAFQDYVTFQDGVETQRIVGIEVLLIPWFEGVCVIPDDIWTVDRRYSQSDAVYRRNRW